MSENQVRSYSVLGENVSQLTSSLQVGWDSPVLHPELGWIRSFLKGGHHFSAQFPIAGGQRERRTFRKMWEKRKALKGWESTLAFSIERVEGVQVKEKRVFPVTKRTHLRMMTLPWAVACIEPSSWIAKLALTLSIKNKPSGSFFATAYHIPVYYEK